MFDLCAGMKSRRQVYYLASRVILKNWLSVNRTVGPDVSLNQVVRYFTMII